MVQFGGYRFDRDKLTLSRQGIPVPIEPLAARLLGLLIEHRDRVVARGELVRELWPEGASDTVVNYTVSRARHAVKHHPGEVLTTVRGHGYRFALDVDDCEEFADALVDRSTELQALRRLAKATTELAQPRFALVTGPAGIGKSRLIQELVQEWLEDGGRVASGAAFDGMPAMWPWDSVFTTLKETGSSPPPIPEAKRVRVRGDLPSPQGERHEYYVGVRKWLERAAARKRLLVVLEDLHLADDGTRLLLESVAGALRGASVLLVAACRTPLPRNSELVTRLARHATVLSLDPLGEPGARRLLRSTAPARLRPETEVAALALAAGNPLFLREIALGLALGSELLERPAAATERPAIQDAICWHLASLDAGARRVLAVAAVSGDEFELHTLGAVLEQSMPALLGTLTAAVGMQVIHPLSPLKFRFSHTLLRQHLYESIAERERRDWHWRLGQVLLKRRGRPTGPVLSQIAYHLAEGALSKEQATAAASFGRRSADACQERFAFAAAAAEYERTLGLAEVAGGSNSECAELMVRAADCLRVCGAGERARELSRRAADVARANDDAVGFAEAVIVLVRSDVDWIETGNVPWPQLEAALAGLPCTERRLRARLLSHWAEPAPWSDSVELLERRITASAEAVELARGLDDRTLAFALFAQARVEWSRLSERKHWLSLIQESIAAAQRASEPELELQATWLLATANLERGDLALSDEWAGRALARSEQLGLALIPYFYLARGACMAIFRGDADAASLSQSAAGVGMAISQQLAEQGCQAQLMMVAWEHGAIAPLVPALAAFADPPGADLLFVAALGLWWAALGEKERARTAFERVTTADFTSRSNTALAALAACGELCAVVGDRASAEILYARLLPFERYLGTTGATYAIAALPAYALARLSASLGELDAARAHFVVAREVAAKLGSEPWVRRCDAGLKRVATRALSDWAPRSFD